MVEEKIFETLYSLDKKNKKREWDIKVDNKGTYSDIIIVHGGKDSRKIESVNRISEGKNINKKNKTTHYQQACKEAMSKWTKKRDIEGYKTKNIETFKIIGEMVENETQTLDSIMDNAIDTGIKILAKKFTKCNFNITVQSDKNIINTWIQKHNINCNITNENTNENVNTKPMLANDYHKQKSKLKFPCYIEPKLDGMRLIYDSNNESILSRQGKSFDILKESDLMKELRKLNETNLVFDGELYLHGGIFEHLGVLRKKKITKEELIKLNKIEYHIYDIIDENNGYSERYKKLKDIITGFTKIKLVKCIEINNESDIKQYHSQFIEQGYEGSMLRNKDGGYKCKYRSNNLLKYKDWMDSEFKIVDYKFETDTSGDNDNLIMWVCKLENGDTIDIRPKGSHTERKHLYKECQENFNKYKGRNLWVKFFGYTEKNSLRFPSTKTDSVESYIRDVIE